MKTPYIITGNSVSVTFGSDLKVFTKGSAEYEKVVEFIKNEDDNGLTKYLTEFQRNVSRKSNGIFRVEEDMIFMKDENGDEFAVPRVFGKRVKQFYEEGLPYSPLVKFWHRLMKNRSEKVVQRLFDCLETNNHPILTDGRFLAWRKVRRHSDGNLYDIHTGKISNNVGEKPRMPHNQVDENDEVTCSRGYHGSSWEYAKNHYGTQTDVMIEVAIDPEDVVAVPHDYNNQKMRVASYEVLRIVELEKTSSLSKVYDEEPDFEEKYCDNCGEMWNMCICEDE